MQSLSDDLLLGVLEYLADPADWARWSASCRRFRYNVGAPLCLQLVQLERTSSSSSCKRFYLPQLIFVEFPDSTRLARAHQVQALVQQARSNTTDVDTTTTKYRLFTFHAPSKTRAYLGRNHEHPNPLRHTSTEETHVHGLAFHVDASPFSFRSSQQHQYWILHSNDNDHDDNNNVSSDNNNNDDESSSGLFVTRQMHIVGNCSTCPPFIYHPSAPRLLTVDYRGNWFVHARAHDDNGAAAAAAAAVHHPQRPRNTYGLQVWTATTTPTRRLRVLLPAIPIQPKPFLSHNGGWNIYEPNVWESVLATDVRNGMTRHAQQLGRSTSLYFHVWIQDSRLYIHAQYIVFPLSIPILQQDQVLVVEQQQQQQQQQHRGHDANDNDDKAAKIFLCNFLWTLFAHDSPRWYAIRHYLSMAANELEHLRRLTRRQVERGLDPITNPVLPPPARVDNVDDAQDDGSMGLTATHAANTWIVPPRHVREYFYQAVYVEDPDRPQLRPWNNVLNVITLSDNDDDDDATLDPNAPNVAKNMNQPAWSIVFYA